MAEESRGTGGAGRLSGRGDPEWEGVAKAGGTELELCGGKQIPKVAWRGRLEEWIKCPVDACETGVRMTQLGWESCRPG